MHDEGHKKKMPEESVSVVRRRDIRTLEYDTAATSAEMPAEESVCVVRRRDISKAIFIVGAGVVLVGGIYLAAPSIMTSLAIFIATNVPQIATNAPQIATRAFP
jgi:hypothetical protein